MLPGTGKHELRHVPVLAAVGRFQYAAGFGVAPVTVARGQVHCVGIVGIYDDVGNSEVRKHIRVGCPQVAAVHGFPQTARRRAGPQRKRVGGVESDGVHTADAVAIIGKRYVNGANLLPSVADVLLAFLCLNQQVIVPHFHGTRRLAFFIQPLPGHPAPTFVLFHARTAGGFFAAVGRAVGRLAGFVVGIRVLVYFDPIGLAVGGGAKGNP